MVNACIFLSNKKSEGTFCPKVLNLILAYHCSFAVLGTENMPSVNNGNENLHISLRHEITE